MACDADAPVGDIAPAGDAKARRDSALQTQRNEILPQQRDTPRIGFDGDDLSIFSGRECQLDRDGADMGADVVNQIARFDEALQQRDFVARVRAELLDLAGGEVSGERRQRTEDALHLDGARALRSKSIPPMLEPAPHGSISIVHANGTLIEPDNSRFLCRRETGRATLRRLDPPDAGR